MHYQKLVWLIITNTRCSHTAIHTNLYAHFFINRVISHYFTLRINNLPCNSVLAWQHLTLSKLLSTNIWNMFYFANKCNSLAGKWNWKSALSYNSWNAFVLYVWVKCNDSPYISTYLFLQSHFTFSKWHWMTL